MHPCHNPNGNSIPILQAVAFELRTNLMLLVHLLCKRARGRIYSLLKRVVVPRTFHMPRQVCGILRRIRKYFYEINQLFIYVCKNGAYSSFCVGGSVKISTSKLKSFDQVYSSVDNRGKLPVRSTVKIVSNPLPRTLKAPHRRLSLPTEY